MRASQGGQWLEGLFEVSPEHTALSLRSPHLSALTRVPPFPCLVLSLCGDRPWPTSVHHVACLSLLCPPLLYFPLGVSPVHFLFLLGFPSSSATLGPVCISPPCLWKGAAPLWTVHHQLWLLQGDLLSPCHLAEALGDRGGFSWGRTRQRLSLEPV